MVHKICNTFIVLLLLLSPSALVWGEQDSSYRGNTAQESIDSDPSEVEPSLLEGKEQPAKFNLFSSIKETCSKDDEMAEIIDFCRIFQRFSGTHLGGEGTRSSPR